MPTVTLKKKEVLKRLGKKVDDATLKEHISFLGTDLEAITQDEIIVEIFPNRPDLLSEQGLARALSSFMGIKTGLRNYVIKKSSYQLIVDGSVSSVRPYTACAVVKGLTLNEDRIEEIIQIQEKLHITYGRNRKKTAIGIYPLEKIAWPIQYLAKKPSAISFVPLESTQPMNGKQILETHPKGKEFAHLLEGANVYPLFIDANKHVLSMPPIINSDDVGKVSPSTKDVFIECSGFNLHYLQTCLSMIVTALADMGGTIYEVKMKYSNKTIVSPQLDPQTLPVDISYVNNRLGLALKEPDVKKYLAKMGIGWKNKKALIPAYRGDILHQVDLTEDIAIGYGYDNFQGEMANVHTVGKELPLEIFSNKLREICVGLGLTEVKQNNLTSVQLQNTAMLTKVPLVSLANALSEEWSVMRAWLIPGLLHALQNNKVHEYPQNIFEIGRVFDKKKEVAENEHLAIALCHKDADFTSIKQQLDTVFQSLDLVYTIEEMSHPSFINGRIGKISIEGKEVAQLGEIHPHVLTNFEMTMPVSVLEINITELFQHIKKK